MAWDKLDIVFKKFFNRRSTSDNKKYYEESGDVSFEFDSNDIRSQVIPFNDPTQAVADNIAEFLDGFALTQDISVPNYQCWYADLSGIRKKDFISDKHGVSYKIRLFDNNMSEIFQTDAIDWIFDYPTGNLLISGDLGSISQPLRISGYRYIGSRMNEPVPNNIVVSNDWILDTDYTGDGNNPFGSGNTARNLTLDFGREFAQVITLDNQGAVRIYDLTNPQIGIRKFVFTNLNFPIYVNSDYFTIYGDPVPSISGNRYLTIEYLGTEIIAKWEYYEKYSLLPDGSNSNDLITSPKIGLYKNYDEIASIINIYNLDLINDYTLTTSNLGDQSTRQIFKITNITSDDLNVSIGADVILNNDINLTRISINPGESLLLIHHRNTTGTQDYVYTIGEIFKNRYFSDFDGFNVPSRYGIIKSGVGSGTFMSSAINEDNIGSLESNTGTDFDGFTSIRTNPKSYMATALSRDMYLSQIIHMYYTDNGVKIGTPVSDITDHYKIAIGFINGVSNINDLVSSTACKFFFLYDINFSPNWVCVANGYFYDSGVLVAPEYSYEMSIRVLEGCTNIKFYIDNTLVATSSNVRFGVGNEFCEGHIIQKYTGNSNRGIKIGYIEFKTN